MELAEHESCESGQFLTVTGVTCSLRKKVRAEKPEACFHVGTWDPALPGGSSDGNLLTSESACHWEVRAGPSQGLFLLL